MEKVWRYSSGSCRESGSQRQRSSSSRRQHAPRRRTEQHRGIPCRLQGRYRHRRGTGWRRSLAQRGRRCAAVRVFRLCASGPLIAMGGGMWPGRGLVSGWNRRRALGGVDKSGPQGCRTILDESNESRIASTSQKGTSRSSSGPPTLKTEKTNATRRARNDPHRRSACTVALCLQARATSGLTDRAGAIRFGGNRGTGTAGAAMGTKRRNQHASSEDKSPDPPPTTTISLTVPTSSRSTRGAAAGKHVGAGGEEMVKSGSGGGGGGAAEAKTGTRVSPSLGWRPLANGKESGDRGGDDRGQDSTGFHRLGAIACLCHQRGSSTILGEKAKNGPREE